MYEFNDIFLEIENDEQASEKPCPPPSAATSFDLIVCPWQIPNPKVTKTKIIIIIKVSNSGVPSSSWNDSYLWQDAGC